MTENYFQIPLSVQPKEWGKAELVPPKVLSGLNYRFIIVKDEGEEGIIRLVEPEALLKKVGKDKDCKRLTAKQMDTLKKSYQVPKIKSKYRMRTQAQGTDEVEIEGEQFEVDNKGNRIIDTFQTVRSGFYLIDVPIKAQSTEK